MTRERQENDELDERPLRNMAYTNSGHDPSKVELRLIVQELLSNRTRGSNENLHMPATKVFDHRHNLRG